MDARKKAQAAPFQLAGYGAAAGTRRCRSRRRCRCPGAANAVEIEGVDNVLPTKKSVVPTDQLTDLRSWITLNHNPFTAVHLIGMVGAAEWSRSRTFALIESRAPHFFPLLP